MYQVVPQYRDVIDIILKYGIPHSYPSGASGALHRALNQGLDRAYAGEASPLAVLTDVTRAWNIELQR